MYLASLSNQKPVRSVAQSCLTLCDPVDCSPPGSFVHGISQTRTLEWVTISFSRGHSRPQDQTHSSCSAGDLTRSFNHCTTWEAVISLNYQIFWSCSSLSIYQNFLQEDKFTYESACYIDCCLRRQLDPQTRPQREGECEGSWGVKVLGGNGCLDLPEKWRVRKRINPGGK